MILLEVQFNKRANYLTSKRRCFHELRKRRGRRQNNPDQPLKDNMILELYTWYISENMEKSA